LHVCEFGLDGVDRVGYIVDQFHDDGVITNEMGLDRGGHVLDDFRESIGDVIDHMLVGSRDGHEVEESLPGIADGLLIRVEIFEVDVGALGEDMRLQHCDMVVLVMMIEDVLIIVEWGKGRISELNQHVVKPNTVLGVQIMRLRPNDVYKRGRNRSGIKLSGEKEDRSQK
jgi:hypothetical protein